MSIDMICFDDFCIQNQMQLFNYSTHGFLHKQHQTCILHQSSIEKWISNPFIDQVLHVSRNRVFLSSYVQVWGQVEKPLQQFIRVKTDKIIKSLLHQKYRINDKHTLHSSLQNRTSQTPFYCRLINYCYKNDLNSITTLLQPIFQEVQQVMNNQTDYIAKALISKLEVRQLKQKFVNTKIENKGSESSEESYTYQDSQNQSFNFEDGSKKAQIQNQQNAMDYQIISQNTLAIYDTIKKDSIIDFKSIKRLLFQSQNMPSSIVSEILKMAVTAEELVFRFPTQITSAILLQQRTEWLQNITYLQEIWDMGEQFEERERSLSFPKSSIMDQNAKRSHLNSQVLEKLRGLRNIWISSNKDIVCLRNIIKRLSLCEIKISPCNCCLEYPLNWRNVWKMISEVTSLRVLVITNLIFDKRTTASNIGVIKSNKFLEIIALQDVVNLSPNLLQAIAVYLSLKTFSLKYNYGERVQTVVEPILNIKTLQKLTLTNIKFMQKPPSFKKFNRNCEILSSLINLQSLTFLNLYRSHPVKSDLSNYLPAKHKIHHLNVGQTSIDTSFLLSLEDFDCLRELNLSKTDILFAEYFENRKKIFENHLQGFRNIELLNLSFCKQLVGIDFTIFRNLKLLYLEEQLISQEEMKKLRKRGIEVICYRNVKIEEE